MPLTPQTTAVAWIGTGVMGAPMAGHLIRAGYRLTVHNRTRDKAEPLLNQGAQWADSPGEAAAQADAVVTMAGYPDDVESIYLGKGGIVDSAKPGAVLIDMTTSDPELAVKIAAAAHGKGLRAIDAPVSGGQNGAEAARLSIMVGAAQADFSEALPLLSTLGRTIVRQGGPGMGQQAKLCNQIAIAGQMMAVAEALVYAQAAGLDARKVHQSLSAGAAAGYTIEHMWPKMAQGDYDPGFYVHHFIKDMDLALNESERLHLFTPALGLARLIYDRVVELGGEELGTQAIHKALQQRV